MFPKRHLNQGVLQVGLAGSLLGEPDFVETLSADAAAEVGMELKGQGSVCQLQGKNHRIWTVIVKRIPPS